MHEFGYDVVAHITLKVYKYAYHTTPTRTRSVFFWSTVYALPKEKSYRDAVTNAQKCQSRLSILLVEDFQ